MPHLSPTTLTHAEQRLILRATAKHARDHLIYSLALGTGLRLSEIVGLNVGDLFNGNGRPRTRVRIRREIAKGGKAGDVSWSEAFGGDQRLSDDAGPILGPAVRAARLAPYDDGLHASLRPGDG